MGENDIFPYLLCMEGDNDFTCISHTEPELILPRTLPSFSYTVEDNKGDRFYINFCNTMDDCGDQSSVCMKHDEATTAIGSYTNQKITVQGGLSITVDKTVQQGSSLLYSLTLNLEITS